MDWTDIDPGDLVQPRPEGLAEPVAVFPHRRHSSASADLASQFLYAIPTVTMAKPPLPRISNLAFWYRVDSKKGAKKGNTVFSSIN
jgi:hypothetical protein